jgi:heme/copper-type cytochrome/quinol oxidase subunit 2
MKMHFPANASNSSEVDSGHDILLSEDFQVPVSYVVGLSALFLWTLLNSLVVVRAEHAEVTLTEGGSTTALQYIQLGVCNTVVAACKLLENILRVSNASCTAVLLLEQFFNVFHAASILQVLVLALQRLTFFQFPKMQCYNSRGFRIFTFSVYPIAIVLEIPAFVELKRIELLHSEYCYGSEFSFSFFHDELAKVQYWLRFVAVRVLPCVILLPVIILLVVILLKTYRRRIHAKNVTATQSFLNDSVVVFISSTTFFIEILYIIVLGIDDVQRKTRAMAATNIFRHLITDAILLLTYTWFFFYHTILGTKERKYVHEWRKKTISSLTRPSRYFTVRKKQRKNRSTTVSSAQESSPPPSAISVNLESTASGILEREL